MQEYTKAYLNAYSWANQAYNYMLGLTNSETIKVTEDDMLNSASTILPGRELEIKTSQDWNYASTETIKALGSFYAASNQIDSYLEGLYTQFNSRLKETEDRAKEIENITNSIRNELGFQSSTAIHLKGGDSNWIDYDFKFYQDVPLLQNVAIENIFKLKDTGFFSSIRSMGGFAGSVEVEKQLGPMIELGDRLSIADGSKITFWSTASFYPAPVRADSDDIPWLPEEYKHGHAYMLTYFMDRPTHISEVYIDPIVTEPFDIVAITYSPFGMDNIAPTPTFEATGSWTTTASAFRENGIGVDDSYGYVVTAPSGYVSYLFDLQEALTRSISGVTSSASSGDIQDTRVEFFYTMRGLGDSYAGARIRWIDTNGDEIGRKTKEDFPTGFFRTMRLVDFAPTLATSAVVDFGIFTPISSNASAFFDNVSLYVGEQRVSINQEISKPTTIPISSRNGPILSSRVSFIISQRNPRRESVNRLVSSAQSLSIPNNIDETIIKQLESISGSKVGRNDIQYVYRTGIKELDLRYREHIPRGRLVSTPLRTKKEIRKIWVSAEHTVKEDEGIAFYVYPFSSDINYRVAVNPYIIGTTTQALGETLSIYTTEEVDSSNVQATSDNSIIVNPKSIREVFQGTDREGRLTLNNPIHHRRVRVNNVRTWLDVNSIRPPVFDPNSETLYGISNETTKNLIKAGSIEGLTVAASNIVSDQGYIPIRVTVKTDKWVASPDTFGKPDKSTISVVRGEILEDATTTDIFSASRSDVMSFSAWMNNTTVQNFLALGINDPALEFFREIPGSTDLYKAIRRSSSDVFLTTSDTSSSTEVNTQRLFNWYNRLRSDNKIPRDINQTLVSTSSVSKEGVYKTKYSPLVVGPGNLYLELFWYNSTDETYVAIPRSSYIADPLLGLVTVTKSAPSSGFNTVYANYRHIAREANEDFTSNIFDYVTETSSSIASATSVFSSYARNLPITRNMTDYETGRTPVLRSPDLDRLSSEWYPVIEYYVTSEGDLVFSRDFFKYGDVPAEIVVEYETLGIEPRVCFEIARTSNPTVSSAISNTSLFVKETSPIPSREVI